MCVAECFDPGRDLRWHQHAFDQLVCIFGIALSFIRACPYEAEGYTEDTDQLVEGVLMPSEIAAWIKTFCDTHHKDVPFKKRKRKPYDPRKGDFGAHRKPGGG